MEWAVNLPTRSEESLRSQHLPVISAGRCSISTIARINRIADIRTTWGNSLVRGTRWANASLPMLNVATPMRRRPKWKPNASLTSCRVVPIPIALISTWLRKPINTSATKDDLIFYKLTIIVAKYICIKMHYSACSCRLAFIFPIIFFTYCLFWILNGPMHVIKLAKTNHILSLWLISLSRITQDKTPFSSVFPLDNSQPYP